MYGPLSRAALARSDATQNTVNASAIHVLNKQARTRQSGKLVQKSIAKCSFRIRLCSRLDDVFFEDHTEETAYTQWNEVFLPYSHSSIDDGKCCRPTKVHIQTLAAWPQKESGWLPTLLVQGCRCYLRQRCQLLHAATCVLYWLLGTFGSTKGCRPTYSSTSGSSQRPATTLDESTLIAAALDGIQDNLPYAGVATGFRRDDCCT